MSANINYVISPTHLNTMMSCAEETYKQKKTEFLEAAIEHLNQYSLHPEQNNKIIAILENIASGNFEQTLNFEKTVIQSLPLCQMMDCNTVALPNEIWLRVYSLLDLQSCHSLSVIDHQFRLFSQQYVLQSFPKVAKSVEIIDTEYGEIPAYSKLKIIKLFEKTNPKTIQKFKCLIMRQGFCINELVQHEKNLGMDFVFSPNLETFLKAQSAEKTYPIFISNEVLDSSWAIDDEERHAFLEEEGCELPTFLELFAFRLFNKSNRENDQPFALSSTSVDELNNKIIISLGSKIENVQSYPLMRIHTSALCCLLFMHGKLK